MALSIPEKIAQVAEHFAKHATHGYSQPNRGSGGTETIALSDGTKVTVTNSDVDCSEMVRQCVNAALSGSHKRPIEFMFTGNEDEQLKSQGFTRITYSASKVKRGDVLWVSGHTGVALGGGKQADAHGDEYGGITGPSRGDQTGHEVEVRSLRSWTYIYRYQGSGESVPPFVAATFTFTAAAECNVRSGPTTGSGKNITGRLDPGEQVMCDGFVPANGNIWATYISYSGKRRYVSMGNQHSWSIIS